LREFTNVVEALEEYGKAGNINNCEVYFCMDNSTVESALKKITSSSLKLLLLVIRLIAVQAKYSVVVRVCLCADTRMIASGGDGLSRGQVNERVMSGEPMAAILPLRLTPLKHSNVFLNWIRSWVGQYLLFLEPLDWFEWGNSIPGWALGEDGFYRTMIEKGKYLWQPPPVAT
jgi:hypothetical protein